MLQSPKFLFHVEAGPDGRSIDYDIASRLSYLLWNTMPDADAVRRGRARRAADADGRERAARRMLDNPRARQALDEFFNEWLRFDRVANAVKGRATLSRVHAGAGRGDGRRDADACSTIWSGTTGTSWRRSPPITAS